MIRNLFLGTCLILTGLLLVSCTSTPKTSESQTVEAENTSTEQKTPTLDGKIVGKYEGTLPGADNPGCRYTIVFEENGTCSVTRLYLAEENPKPQTVTGTYEYSMANNPNVTCRFEKESPFYFQRENRNAIIMVDAQGNAPEHQELYTLRRIDSEN